MVNSNDFDAQAFVAYQRQVQSQLNEISSRRETPEQRFLALAVAELRIKAADRLIEEFEGLVAAQRSALVEVRELCSTASYAAAIAKVDAALVKVMKMQSDSALAKALPLAEHGKKFISTGGGHGKLRQLVGKVMKSLPAGAKSQEIWAACEKSSQAKKMGITFHGDHVWVKDQGQVGRARFGNIISEIRKDTRSE